MCFTLENKPLEWGIIGWKMVGLYCCIWLYSGKLLASGGFFKLHAGFFLKGSRWNISVTIIIFDHSSFLWHFRPTFQEIKYVAVGCDWYWGAGDIAMHEAYKMPIVMQDEFCQVNEVDKDHNDDTF